MILLDVNILIYAYNPDAPQQPAAAAWLKHAFNSSDTIGIPWPTIWGFLRVTTSRYIGHTAARPAEAVGKVRDWLAQPRVTVVEPGPRHIEILECLIIEGQATGPLVSDAAVAALAIEHGATLASTNRDFSRFPNLRWVNPLC